MSARSAGGIALALMVSAAASVGFAVSTVVGASIRVQGGLLMVALLALAVALWRWAERLMPQGPFVEERPNHRSDPRVQASVEETVERLPRRRFLRRLLILTGGAFAAALLVPLRALGPRPGEALRRTPWRPGVRVVGQDGQPIRPEDLAQGGLLTVFPEGALEDADAAAVLMRVDPARLALPEGREGWVADGNVAYSKICTHAGCPVGLYEEQTDRLFCPCHQSMFDVLRGARPLSGPATRPLPQLPLEVGEDGFLRAGGEFSAPVGPSFWDLSP